MISGRGVGGCRSIGAAAAVIVMVIAAATLFAQTQSTEVHLRFNSGQSITPIYEGWERVPDGSFNMVFGYLNRNHVEQISLPVGAQNNFEPGPADRGQPAYFYPRENHFIFRVNVPKDWDEKKELVWSLTVRGKTETARATLLDIWEIDRKLEVANNGGGVQVSNALIAKDEPPAVTIDPVAGAKVATAVTLTANVSDDGIPPANMKRREPRPVEPSLKYSGLPSPVNVPMPARPRPPVGGGLSVWWIVYRGPAAVTFDPEGYVKVADGKSVVKATFTQPGTYVIRAFAHDGLLRTLTDLTINVTQ
jgi:hypothetical protein